MATRKIKHRYLQLLGIIIMLLALVRCIFIGDSRDSNEQMLQASESWIQSNDSASHQERFSARTSHPVKSPFIDYAVTFNDSNHIQLVAAQQWGVPPVKNREDAEQRKYELVYMGCSPYYDLAHLDASIPYLVPHAAILLQDIGIAFTDSLMAHKMPLYRMVVSSVLRSEADVARLRRNNPNATERSCHLYATTFDINYATFHPIGSAPQPDAEMEIRLKNILGRVLYDLRSRHRCYVKYERIMPCFHITVR